MKLESFLTHARRRVGTSPQKVPIIIEPHTALRPSPFHPCSELHFAFWEVSVWVLSCYSCDQASDVAGQVRETFSVARTSLLNALFGAGVTGVRGLARGGVVPATVANHR